MQKSKIYAKINLTLDIVGVENGFHNINSFVSSVSLYDTVCVKKRRDNDINLIEEGIFAGCEKKDNNAYKTAVEFIGVFKDEILKRNKFYGVDLFIKKNIPVGAGLGGSSCDIAGTLVSLSKLFKIKDKNALRSLAESLGSDVNYMIKGGYAVILGKGDKVSKIEEYRKFYYVIMTAEKGVLAKDSYKAFDKQGLKQEPCTFRAVEYYKNKDDKFFLNLKNDLYLPSKTLNGEIESNLNALKEYCPAFMTGSGSAVVGIFKSKKERDFAYKSLLLNGYKNLIKAKTV